MLFDADRFKREKLLDILRRVIANPGNAAEVADEISRDWFPTWECDPKGNWSVRLGTGQKK
jgi:hypothetical protein